jgi:hypothetical protein
MQRFDYAVAMELSASQNMISNLLIRQSGVAGIRIDGSSGNTIRHTAITRGEGVGYLQAAGQNKIEQSVIWSNTSHAVDVLGTVEIKDSVLHASGTNVYVYSFQTNSRAVADFNNLYLENGALYALLGGVPRESLPRWSAGSSQDIHSISVNPLFHDAANYDFHPRSEAGRFNPASNAYVLGDAGYSLLIDFGSTNGIFTNEPAPNGGRINIGVHGNTVEASKSRTDPWLYALTASPGGRIGGVTALEKIFLLVWGWGGMSGTNLVQLDYSFNNGATWTNIAVNVPVGQHEFLWNSGLENDPGVPRWLPSTIARWKVTLQSDTNVFDMTDDYFALNGPFTFYINDASTNFDIFTTAPGSDTNFGGSFPNAPKYSLRSVLEDNDVDGEDNIVFDTGVYIISNELVATVEAADAGRAGNPLIIRGSTNAFGAVIDRTAGGGLALQVSGGFVFLQDFTVLGGDIAMAGVNGAISNVVFTNGSLVLTGPQTLARDVRIRQGSLTANGGGIQMQRILVETGSVSLLGSALLENTAVQHPVGPVISANGNHTIINNTLASGSTAFQQDGAASFSVLENNIIVANGAGGEAFCLLINGGAVASDYNNLVARNNAWIGNANGNWEKLLYWQRESLQDLHSIAAEPRFVSEAGLDFHLQSTAGHYTPGGFVPDAQDSPSIDSGNPLSPFDQEPDYHGNRINMGAFGNTEQASRSRVTPWLLAQTLNDGGVFKGTNLIRWVSGNIDPTNTLALQYSPDGGNSWTTFASGLAATSTFYSWDTTLQTSSLNALWGVYVEANSNVADVTDNRFALRNDPLAFYVNDNSTNQDVYTQAIGHPTNNGLTVFTPVSTLQGILTNYDLEGRDIIYVDTGAYSNSAPLFVFWSDGGDLDGNLVIQGSTNADSSGSVLVRGGSDGISVVGSRVTLRDLTIMNAARGIYFFSNRNSTVERVLTRNNNYGLFLDLAVNSTLRNVRVWNNSAGGILLQNTATTLVEHFTFVANQGPAYELINSRDDVFQNNIVVVTNNFHALSMSTSLIASTFIDYNLYYFGSPTNPVLIHDSATNLLNWQRARGKDYRSAVTNPLLHDVAGGDFHLRSTVGRFQPGTGWVVDGQHSFAIDGANPASPFTNEPAPHNRRANMGAFGNTIFASQSDTNPAILARSLNDAMILTTNDNPFPLIWREFNVPTGTTVRIEYSGDGGSEWVTLATGIPVLQEFFSWNLTPTYNSYNGLWRVTVEGGANTNLFDNSDAATRMFFGTFQISQEQIVGSQRAVTFRGAWDEDYRLQYAETRVGQNLMWTNVVGSFTNLFPGGDAILTDLTGGGSSYRLYRVIWENPPPGAP